MDIGFFVGQFLERHPDAIEEANKIDLTNKTGQARWKRSLKYDSKLVKVKLPYIMYLTRREGSDPESTSGEGVHMQVIHPLGIKKGMTLNQVKKMLMGDIEVWCNCPDFNYGGFYYMLSIKRPIAALSSDEIKSLSGVSGFLPGRAKFSPPNIRNPQRKGALCKHLYSVLSTIQTHATSIFSKLPKSDKDKESS